MLGTFGFHRRAICALHFLAGLALCGLWPARADILLSTNSTWRYFKGTAEASNPTNAWRETNFDDSAWLVGHAPFHYGPNPMCGGGDDTVIGGVTNCAFGGTILSDMRSNYTCIFMRQKFVVADTSVLTTLSFRFSVDDGMAVWINGKAPRLPVGISSFTYTNTASPQREATAFIRTDISGFITNLVNGTNVICVQAFNANLTNDDFRIDVELVSSDLKPFPLTANQRGTVTCLESTNIIYDVYLPPAYSVDGEPLPILYTMNPDGGGMVGQFQSVCSSLNIIAIGVMGPRNLTGWDVHFRDFFAVSRDVRQRLLFDPTAEFASGFSGGGESAYYFTRFRAQHVAGVFGMAGWLGRTLGYYSTDRVQTNLLVARATGTSDTAGMYYVPLDSNYLAAAGAVIQDWFFSGGHQVPSDSIKFDCLSWLLSHRTPAGPGDRTNAAARAVDWRARLVSGDRQSVLLESSTALMEKPRTWDAYQAQLILDRLTADYATFRLIDYTPVPYGLFSSDQFYYYGRAAALAGDLPRYRSCLKVLTWIGSINGDRSGDMQALLQQFGYPAPAFQWSADRTISQLSLRLLWAAPRLDGVLQTRTNLAAGAWQDLRVPFGGNDVMWTWELPLSPEAPSVFFRMNTAPRIGYSPPWP